MTPSERQMTDLDRGAVAALRLLLRGQEYAMGEESIQESAETIIEAVESDGLPVVIARERDYELDNFEAEDRDEFPPDLAAIAADVPKTKWSRG